MVEPYSYIVETPAFISPHCRFSAILQPGLPSTLGLSNEIKPLGRCYPVLNWVSTLPPQRRDQRAAKRPSLSSLEYKWRHELSETLLKASITAMNVTDRFC